MRRYILALTAVTALTLPVASQSVEERLHQLEQEHRRVLERLEASETRNIELAASLSALEAETAELGFERSDARLEEQINALTAGFQEARWSTATRSGIPIRFYGFIRFDAYYNTARTNDPITVFRVLREGVEAKRNDDQFELDTRLTRFGLEIDAGTIGSTDVSGRLETDFANFPEGSRESRATPRIRLAYMELSWGNASLRLGQDWDVISPLYPTIHSEFLLWGAGNLGDRRTQVKFIWHSDGEGPRFAIEASLGVTGAIDQADNDGSGGSRAVADGFDSGHPHGQLRLGLDLDSWVDGQRAALGVWGYIAGLETDKKFDGEDHFTPWVAGIDFVLPIVGDLRLRGEAWIGQALSDVRGTILQDISRVTGEEIRAWGGFAELHLQISKSFRIAIGASIDDPDGDDLHDLFGEDRDLNWTAYLSLKLERSKGLAYGFDVIFWETQYIDDELGNMVRINFWTQLDF